MKKMNMIGVLALGVILVSAVGAPLQAQDEEMKIGIWHNDVELGVNLLQSSYSQNWNGGEKGSVVWTGNLNAKMEKQFSEMTNWRNTLKLAYGQTHNQQRNTSGDLYWKKPDKTDDLIDFESMFRWTPQSGWDPFVSFQFLSLFQDLTDAEGRSQNLNPKTFKESAGISRTFIEEEERKLSTRLGVAFIQNNRSFFTEDSAASTETISESSNSVAAEMVTEYLAKALDGRVDWESKLTLSLPITYSGKSVFEDELDLVAAGLPDDLAGYTTSIDVDWDNTFSANITEMIAVKLFVRWVYDKYDNTVTPVVEDGTLVNAAAVHSAIRKAGQFKQTMALGLTYKFM